MVRLCDILHLQIYRILWIGPPTVWNNLSTIAQQSICIGIDSNNDTFLSLLSSPSLNPSISSSSSSSQEPSAGDIVYIKKAYSNPFQANLCIALFLEQYAWYTNKEETLLSYFLSTYGISNTTLAICVQPSDCGIFEYTNYLRDSIPLETNVIGTHGRKRTNSVNSKKSNSNTNKNSHRNRCHFSLERLLTSTNNIPVLSSSSSSSTSSSLLSVGMIEYDSILSSPSYTNRSSFSPPLIHKGGEGNNRIIIHESLIETVIEFTELLEILKTVPVTLHSSSSSSSNSAPSSPLLSATPASSVSNTGAIVSSSFSMLSTSSNPGSFNSQFLSWKTSLMFSSSSSSAGGGFNTLSTLQQQAIDQLSQLLSINFYEVLRISPGHFTEILQRIEGLSLAGVDETVISSMSSSSLSSVSLGKTQYRNQQYNSSSKRPVCIVYAPCNVFQIIYSNSVTATGNVSGSTNNKVSVASSIYLQLPSETYLFHPGPWNSYDDNGTLTVKIPYPIISNHTSRQEPVSSSSYRMATIQLNPWFPSGLTTSSSSSSSSSSLSTTFVNIYNPEIFFNRGLLNWHYQRAQWRYRPLGYSYPVRPKHPCSTSSGGPGNDELFEEIITLLTDTNSGSYPIPGGNMSLTDILEICDDIWDDGKDQSDDDW